MFNVMSGIPRGFSFGPLLSQKLIKEVGDRSFRILFYAEAECMKLLMSAYDNASWHRGIVTSRHRCCFLSIGPTTSAEILRNVQ